MSDELTRELTLGLRELAEGAEAPPPGPGAEVRRAAVRRRRRRRTTAAVAGASVTAALAVLLAVHLTGGGTEERPAPAANPTSTPSTSTPAAPDATVDLSRRVLVIGEREVPISSGAEEAPTPTGRMTVTGKVRAKAETGADVGFEDSYAVKIPWMTELRAPDGSTTFIGAMTYDEKAPGAYDRTSGWIGLRDGDAQLVYKLLAEGAVVEVTGTAPTPTSTTTPSPTPTFSPAQNRVASPTARTSAAEPPADAAAEPPAETPAEASAEPAATPSSAVDEGFFGGVP
ncbi:L,D-transpeptidase [Streptomyces sp. NPDC046862]|uniref:L,D-transpeptidase n=1 Tax=Streptomyces sp. NPDC046862 TaxID=3154603 RepID=UPI003453A71E